jgi:hypothetical protein
MGATIGAMLLSRSASYDGHKPAASLIAPSSRCGHLLTATLCAAARLMATTALPAVAQTPQRDVVWRYVVEGLLSGAVKG